MNFHTYTCKAYCISQNILHMKYSCELFRISGCFGIKLWSFTHEKTSKNKYNNHIFNTITKIMIYTVFWLRNTHLKILELFCS